VLVKHKKVNDANKQQDKHRECGEEENHKRHRELPSEFELFES
jgi:hypothetical protein